MTETDNLLFSTMTHNPQPLHIDAEAAKASEFGQLLVNGTFTFALMIGLSVADTTLGTLVANLGYDKVAMPKPVFIGDTIHADTEVMSLRESRSRPNAGIVTFQHRAINQRRRSSASACGPPCSCASPADPTAPRQPQRAVGIANSAPSRALAGQRCMTDFCRV